MTTARVLLADRFGNLLAETSALLQPVSWRRNDYGRAGLGFARSDGQATADNLKFRNRVLIQFDSSLPDWGGVIVSRRWTEAGIGVEMYSGEYIFKKRTTDKGRYFSDATLGSIFQALIQEANAVADMGIVVGSIWGGGNTHSPRYHYARLLDIFQNRLTERLSTADFYVVPSFSGGKIIFTAHFAERRGSNKPSVTLLEGHNLARMELLEQGEDIVTEWNIAGADTGGGDQYGWGDTRITAQARDLNNINLYGLLQNSEVYGDTTVQATLDDTADNLLTESKEPYNIFDIDAVDLAPALFSEYGVGDSLSLWAPSYGFGGTDTTVHLLQREYDQAGNGCRLIVREEA